MEKSLADQLFDADHLEIELEEKLVDAGIECTKLGWDSYDCSLEIYGVPNDLRLSPEAQKLIYTAGFRSAYVNHLDKWETHYHWDKDFTLSKGWRVSYPHKRGPKE